MKREDLKDLKKAIVNQKVNTLGRKVEWLKIQWISVCKEQSLQFRYRYSHNTLEAWKTIDLKRKTKGPPPDLGRLSLPQLYRGPRPINEKKLADLLQLLEFVPVYHSFYTGLDETADNSDIEHQSDSDED
jgi:hypothetical protein